MKSFFRNVVFCLAVILACALPAHAEELTEAENLTNSRLFTEHSGFTNLSSLYDGILVWGNSVNAPASLTMESEKGIASVYIRFAAVCGEYTVTDPETGVSHVWQQNFLHDFIDLEALFGYIPTSVTLSFESGTITINELTAYSAGTLPEDVQRWELPKDGETDLILFSTHGDDEHLFFAGILPYYAKEMGYQVQLVYMTDHHNNDGVTRMREILDGLWTAGVTAYPVFGTFPDFYRWGIENAYIAFEQQDITREDLISFVVENIRRFKPKVVIGHDFNGEYSHGQHAVYADVLAAAVEISMDAAQYPESAVKYGTWDVPKAYFHLYEENAIVMDWDIPLESFGGLTAWQVSSRYALQKHVSQIDDLEKEDVTWYFGNNPTAASVGRLTPCNFGLYRSTVGFDVEKNDFFENVTTHAQDAEAVAQRLAEEEAAREASEEAARQAEEAARQTEEAARQESLSQATEVTTVSPETESESSLPALKMGWLVPVLLIAVVILVVIMLRRKPPKKYF